MNKCSTRVYAGSFHGHPCKKPAVVERAGKWYCRIHDPVASAERRAKNSAAFVENINERIKAATDMQNDAARYAFLRKHWNSQYKGKPLHRYIEEEWLGAGGIDAILDDAMSVVKLWSHGDHET